MHFASPRKIAIVFLFSAISCKKLVQVGAPINTIVKPAAFQTDNTALSAVSNLYAAMLSNNYYFNAAAYPSLSADEINSTGADQGVDYFSQPFQLNALTSLNYNIDVIWNNTYKMIYAVNSGLEGLAASGTLTDSVKTELTGELKFLRAFYYFYLVNMFGEVPQVTTSDYTKNAAAPRSAVPDIYGQMVADLTDALSGLSPQYPSPNKGRPVTFAAAALLARVYLYMGDWKNAEAQATSVINSGMYNLEPNLNNVFLAGSNETIWQLDLTGSQAQPYTYTAAQYVPYTAGVIPNYAITSWLLNAFEPADNRRTAWLDSSSVNGTVYYYPYKFKQIAGAGYAEFPICLRLSEQYLIRAEARTELGEAGAGTDLNMVRTRAGLPATTATSPSDMLQAIAQERWVELFTEWGDRWFNLKRTNTIDAVLGSEKTGWQPNDSLYPIPYAEIKVNPALTQNPGY